MKIGIGCGTVSSTLTCDIGGLRQRDQIGFFWKYLATMFIVKVAQIFRKLFGLLEGITFKVKTVVATFLATFGEIGLFFTLPSVHTVWRSNSVLDTFFADCNERQT